MPIRDYSKDAENAQKHFFESKKISDTNKRHVKKFLLSYDVSDARRSIFFKHLQKFLEHSKDVKKEMNNRDKINKIFKKLRDTLSYNYYATVVNVTKRFVRWLNDDELPKGFRDLKRMSKKRARRELNSKDMIKWEEGKNLAKFTTSLQFKAMILTQLDAGFRPSEFVDLNYGDVELVQGMVIFNVNKGKTGSRVVPCNRSAPHFLKWYREHPTKKDKDPLWIMENVEKRHPKEKVKNKYKIRRYEYPALKKRVKMISEKAGLKKPVDFYNFRHSSCYLDKIDNLPLEIASNRHGHSVEHFTEIYGRMDTKDVANRVLKHYGQKKEKKDLEKNVVCEVCNNVNEPKSEVCDNCSQPLTLKRALSGVEIKKDMQKFLIKEMEKRLGREIRRMESAKKKRR